MADHLLHRAKAQLRHVLAHLLGDVLEEVDDELGLAAEALAQFRVLGGHTDRAGVEMADAHHHAPTHHQRRCGETKLFGTEQGGNDNVVTGLQLPVCLDHDPVPQPVEQKGLLGLGQTELPWRTGVLQRRQG